MDLGQGIFGELPRRRSRRQTFHLFEGGCRVGLPFVSSSISRFSSSSGKGGVCVFSGCVGTLRFFSFIELRGLFDHASGRHVTANRLR